MIKSLKDWTNQEIIDSIIKLTDNSKLLPYDVLAGIKEQAKELKKRLQPRIKIEVRDWYDGFNYYHSTRVYIDTGKGYELIGHNPFAWGSVSNRGYEEEAYNLLVEAGIFPKIEGNLQSGAKKGLYWFITNELRDNRHRYDIITKTVRRKRDL